MADIISPIWIRSLVSQLGEFKQTYMYQAILRAPAHAWSLKI